MFPSFVVITVPTAELSSPATEKVTSTLLLGVGVGAEVGVTVAPGVGVAVTEALGDGVACGVEVAVAAGEGDSVGEAVGVDDGLAMNSTLPDN